MRAWGALAMLVGVQLSVPGLYLPPVSNLKIGSISAPKDHFSAGPHCGVSGSSGGCVDCAGSCPTVRARSVSSSSVRVKAKANLPTPHDHFTSSPHCMCAGFGLQLGWQCSSRYHHIHPFDLILAGECRQRSVSPSHWASGFLPWPARTPATPLAM